MKLIAVSGADEEELLLTIHMISFPNCKINLGLNIISRRQDGFHDIETVFYPIPFRDALEVVRTENEIDHFQFTSSGIKINGAAEENLCIQAYQLLKSKFPQLPSLKMHLHKAIPIGAGLGGGSADAAFTLKLVNQEFQLNLSTEKFIDYSLLLGSDIPFFIINKPCLATGRGEILQPVRLDLSEYKIVIVYPGIHINTAWAFSQLKVPDIYSVGDPSRTLNILEQPPGNWKDQLTNDFEPIVFKKYPEIKEIKKKLSMAGASYCSMSGSGSSVYALFKKDETISVDFPDAYLIKEFFL